MIDHQFFPLVKPFIAIGAFGMMVLLSRVAEAASFMGLGVLPVASSSGATAVSDDGSIVVGTVPWDPNGPIFSDGSEVFRWTAASGMEVIGDLPGGPLYGRKPSVSNNGVLVAIGSDVESNQKAARWTDTIGWESLGARGEIASDANDVSADGSVIVGTSYLPGARGQQAFRWTEATGIVFLEGLHNERGAAAVSADGDTVAGGAFWFDGERNRGESFRWTAANGMVGLGHLPGDDYNYATNISADGAVIVGQYFSFSDFVRRGFRWTEKTGMVAIPILPGAPNNEDNQFLPSATSGDGSVIVGGNLIWDEANGTRLLKDVLIGDYGLVEEVADWTRLYATGISADGRVIVGAGINPSEIREAWIAILDPAMPTPTICGDYNNNGTVEQADLDLVLLNWGKDAVPSGWLNDLPTGAIDQEELDKVLLGWGAGTPVSAETSSVPEPRTTAVLCILILAHLSFTPLHQQRDGVAFSPHHY